MAVKIRLTRMGDKKNPFYRIVVADSRKSRDGEYIDQIGTYNPVSKNEKEIVKVDAEKAQNWLNNGAQPTDTVKQLLKKANVEKKPKAKKETKAKASKAEVKKEATKSPAKKATTTKAPAKKTTKKAE